MKSTRFVLCVLAATACGHGGISDKVRDSDYAHLDPAQTANVQAPRAELAQAQDELTRAKVKLQEARQEKAVSDAEDKMTEASLQRAKAEDAKAKSLGDPALIERAKQLYDQAGARARAGEARDKYVATLIEAREADLAAAQRHVDLANAKVELAKLQALEAAKSPVVSQYDQSSFYDDVAKAQRKYDDARVRAAKLDEQAKAAQAKADDLAKKVPVAGQ